MQAVLLRFNRKNILLVDDSKFNLKVLTDILKSQPYNIFAVNNGEKALEFVKRKKVDLILIDVLMPDLDGLEVCKKLKSNSDSKEIPIIFISILDKSKDIVKGFRAGGVDYIVKPFQKEVVLARIGGNEKNLDQTFQKADQMVYNNKKRN